MVYTVWKQNKNKRNPHFSMTNKTSGRKKQKKKKTKKAFAHVQYLHSLVRNLCTGPTKVSKSIKIAVKIHTHKSTPYRRQENFHTDLRALACDKANRRVTR